MIWRINSVSWLLLLELLLFAGSCTGSKEETRRLQEEADATEYFMDDPLEPTTSPTATLISSGGGRVPPGTDKLDDVSSTDDYTVVVLDDQVPWDLTEDGPDLTNEDISERGGPTMYPSKPAPQVADGDDYVVIILEDDVPWDDVAVTEYVRDEFEAIENAKSNSTYDDDDDFYEKSPTPLPTVYVAPTPFPTVAASPTGSPKPTESRNPTGEPTIAPSTTPSILPSDYPSFLPTDRPSPAPSETPSFWCHDEETYRSPINELTCAQHRDTNCLNWRHVGLNMTELETLVNSCPITCEIECGSFKLFSAEVSFRMSRVSGFMGPQDVEALMEFSLEFLEGFVRNYISRNVAKRAKIKSEAESNLEANANVKVEGRMSGSNDNAAEAATEASAANEDDFLNEEVVDGGIVMFEIEAAVLTAQNLVEESPVPAAVARLGVFDKAEILESSGDGLSRRQRLLRTGSLEDLQRTKQQSSGGASIVKMDEALDITITFDGFTIGMNPERMSELLVSGIDSVDFTRELQQSRIDFFSEATVYSATETVEEDFVVEVDLVEEEKERNSAFSVVISYLVPIVVVGFALGSLFYHKCYVKGRWPLLGNKRRRQNAIERAQIGGMTASPMAVSPSSGIGPNNSNDEGSSGGYFNFRRQATTSFNTIEEEEDNGKINAINPAASNDSSNKAEGGQSTFSKFISALNLNLSLTRSKNSTDEDEDKEEGDTSSAPSIRNSDSGNEDELKQQNEFPVICSDLVSPISGDSGNNEAASFDKQQQFKPYPSVLPPMIVIDNIDGPDVAAMSPVMMVTNSTAATAGNSSEFKDSLRSSNTPLNELDAYASEFRKQLIRSSNDATNSRHQSYSGSFYGMQSTSSLDLGASQLPIFGQNSSDEDDSRMIKGMVSDEWDGDDLFSPIPSNITTHEGEDENEEDSLPRPEETSSESDNETSSVESPDSTPIETATKTHNYGTWDGSSPPNLDTKLSSSSLPGALNRDTEPDVPRDRAELPPKRPPTPDRGGISVRPIGGEQQQNRRSSFPKFTPIKALIGGTGGGGSSLGSEGHKRKSSADTAPDLPKNNSSISALSTDSSHNTDRLEFEAPREGNWGLVLESSSKTGPRIYAVKDYSPLFGLVQKGDKLLEIDGKNISQSNLTDVTKLLKGKSSSYPYHRPTSSTMPIVVLRSAHPHASSHTYNNSSASHHRHPQYAEYNHQRNNSYGSYGSYGSGGSSGSRVVKDVDDDSNNNKGIYQLDHHHGSNQQNYNEHSFVDYDSSNEI